MNSLLCLPTYSPELGSLFLATYKQPKYISSRLIEVKREGYLIIMRSLRVWIGISHLTFCLNLFPHFAFCIIFILVWACQNWRVYISYCVRECSEICRGGAAEKYIDIRKKNHALFVLSNFWKTPFGAISRWIVDKYTLTCFEHSPKVTLGNKHAKPNIVHQCEWWFELVHYSYLV